MDRFQILKGEKPPTADEAKFQREKKKLKSLTEAYETLKKQPQEEKTYQQCENCFEFNAGCERPTYKGCKRWVDYR